MEKRPPARPASTPQAPTGSCIGSAQAGVGRHNFFLFTPDGQCCGFVTLDLQEPRPLIATSAQLPNHAQEQLIRALQRTHTLSRIRRGTMLFQSLEEYKDYLIESLQKRIQEEEQKATLKTHTHQKKRR